MARILNGKPCEVTFLDKISNSRITLYFRMPTTPERIKYTNDQVVRMANKVEYHVGEARQEAGLDILLGVKEDAFEADGKPVISDPQKENYNPNWKELVKTYGADIIELLTLHAYDYSVVQLPVPVVKQDPS